MERRAALRVSSWSLVALAASLACSSIDHGSGAPGSDGGPRHPIGKADGSGECSSETESRCGGKSRGNCYCDDQCSTHGDCCSDYATACGSGECTAIFRWLQKDAYAETAGRSSSLWPPHTTTALDIVCGGSVVRSEYRENHGTKPAEKDANGEVFLVEVAKQQVTGPREELESLADAYSVCECGTEFLSMTALDDPKVQQVMAALETYLLQNLTCSGATDTAGLAQLVKTGDVKAALAVLPSCTWANGHDLATGFDAALQEALAQSSLQLSSYHVCNNDAELQASLFMGYATSRAVKACNPSSYLCSSPKWLYAP